MRRTMLVCALLAAGLLGLTVTGCPTSDSDEKIVKVDGSSTVFPITEAMAEDFQAENRDTKVTVGISGTGGGFKKFLAENEAERTDINDGSRPIKGKEIEKAEELGIEFIELPVAYDGLSIVVHPDNDWVDGMTIEQLNVIWREGSEVEKWSDIDSSWPNEEIELFGPGTDSGTFDYFVETVNGKGNGCRNDFQASEDDNVLVQGVAGNEHAMAFFGYAYYVENKDKLKALKIKNKSGDLVAPTPETIENGTYNPLSRPLFIYVSKASLEREEVEKFVDFYLDNAAELAAEVGYIALPKDAYEAARKRLEDRTTGSVFKDAKPGQNITEVLNK